MNEVLLLAGGTGSRMQMEGAPKQYMEVKGIPVFLYSIKTFQRMDAIEGIWIVADEGWRSYIREWLEREHITKFRGFALPGATRQFSILHGLEAMESQVKRSDRVVIHDAARPLVTPRLIQSCLDRTGAYDGAMPVLPVKDTFYQSSDGVEIKNLLPREQLFAGQAPESFLFGRYLEAHRAMTDEEIGKINGSSELAYLAGMKIAMVPGEERNFKITTQADLELFYTYLEENK